MKVNNSLLNQLITSLVQAFGDDLKKVVLFGSYSRGTANEDSDIDVMALFDSDNYSRWEIDQRMLLIGRMIANQVGEDWGKFIDFQMATVETFETSSTPFFREIRRTSIIIYPPGEVK